MIPKVIWGRTKIPRISYLVLREKKIFPVSRKTIEKQHSFLVYWLGNVDKLHFLAIKVCPKHIQTMRRNLEAKNIAKLQM